MDVVEKRRPQDGRIKTRTPDGEEVELRLSTLPTAFGEKLVMRIFDPEVLVQATSRSSASPRTTSSAGSSMTEQPNGIILVTGPDRLGQDHHALLDAEAARHAGSQRLHHRGPDRDGRAARSTRCRCRPASASTSPSGVRTLMRQDPDIIMVGEIRDLETAEMAVQAALTGHLVLSTLHTNDAPSAVTRLLDLGVPPYLLNATLIGVMAQRLVRTLCPHCKQKVELHRAEDVQAWEALVAPWKANRPAQSTSRSAASNAA